MLFFDLFQSGDLLNLMYRVPNKMWENINGTSFESLMLWHVMSADSKVILLEDCSPIDVKILRYDKAKHFAMKF